MTSTPPEAPPPVDGDQGPRVTRDQVRDLGRLRRSVRDRKVAGVAGGLGRHLDIDPVILRVAIVVLVFFGGASGGVDVMAPACCVAALRTIGDDPDPGAPAPGPGQGRLGVDPHG